MDCSLGEVSKRIELGLACSCVSNKIKPQAFDSAGVDEFSSASSFIPAKLVKGLKVLAKCPHGGMDNLEFAIASAQLLAFNRWKGFYELPEFTMLSGLDGDDDEKTGSKRVADDVNWVPDGNKRVSVRKQKPKYKYSEDNIVDDVVPKASKGIDKASEELSNGAKRNSSRKRKPNPKYCEDEEDVLGSHVSKKDISPVAKENSQKGKAKFKHGENGGKADMDEDEDGAHELKDPEGFAKNVNQKEDVLDINVPMEMKDFEGASEEDERIVPKKNQGVSLRKRNPNTKYNEEKEDSEGANKDAIWVPEENKRVSTRKRKPNMKYIEDGDYTFVDMRENRSSNRSSKRSCEVSRGRKLSPTEYPPPAGMLSQLHIAASDPTKGYSLLSPVLGLFSDYRDSLFQWRSKRSGSKVTGVEGSEGSYQADTIERETDGESYRDEKTKTTTPQQQ